MAKYTSSGYGQLISEAEAFEANEREDLAAANALSVRLMALRCPILNASEKESGDHYDTVHRLLRRIIEQTTPVIVSLDEDDVAPCMLDTFFPGQEEAYRTRVNSLTTEYGNAMKLLISLTPDSKEQCCPR